MAVLIKSNMEGVPVFFKDWRIGFFFKSIEMKNSENQSSEGRESEDW